MARPAPSARLEDLVREAEVLETVKSSIPHAWSILEQEIQRLRHAAPSIPTSTQRKRVKLRVPAEEYPDYNFVGRLLGPRGATLKRLERDTACRIMIRGKGSIRKDKEPDVRGKPGWEHVFHEPLHVVIEVVDPPDDAAASRILSRARRLVECLLVPVPEERDSLKRAQLRDLAILNGTHRSVADYLTAPPAHPHHHHHHHHHAALHHPSSPAPRASPASSPPPLRRAMSATNAKHHHPFAHHQQDPFLHPFDHQQAVSFARAFALNPTRPNASPVTQPASSPPPPANRAASTPSTPAPAPPLTQPAQPRHPPSQTSTSLTATSDPLNTTSQPTSTSTNNNPTTTTTTTASFAPASPHSDSGFNLPGLDKLNIPSLNFDHLSEPNLALPTLAMPAASPTIVDPDIYPYPLTPGLPNLDHHLQLNAFASPVWTPSRPLSNSGQQSQPLASPSSAALPPRSPPPMESHHNGASDASKAFLLGRALGDPVRAQGAFRRTKSARQHGELSFEQAFAAHSISDRDNDPPDFSHVYAYPSQREQSNSGSANQGESVLANFFPSSPLAPHMPRAHDLHDDGTDQRHPQAVSFASQEHRLDDRQNQQHREHDQYRQERQLQQQQQQQQQQPQQQAHLNQDQDPHSGHAHLEQLHRDHPNHHYRLDHFQAGAEHFPGN